MSFEEVDFIIALDVPYRCEILFDVGSVEGFIRDDLEDDGFVDIRVGVRVVRDNRSRVAWGDVEGII